MTRVTPVPKHGSLQRYRLELREQKAGRGKRPCDRCKAANNERARTARANRTAGQRRAKLSIVEDVTPAGHTEPPSRDTSVEDVNPREHTIRDPSKRRRIGEMEKAVEEDIAEIDAGMQVPFHRSLSVLAIQLAREIDEPATPANTRSSASRQLFEVLRSLRTKKEGDDNSAVAVALQASGFGTPLVP